MTKATKSDDKKLANFLCFAIYSANLTFGKAYKPILEKLGLTYTQYITLVALHETQDQTVSALGEKMFLESNTLTPILKKLETMGYVSRARDGADERVVRVNLTEAGHTLLNQVSREDLAKLCGINAEEFVRTRDAVLKLRDNLASSLA